jgi:plasmid stabilization system protein ParE
VRLVYTHRARRDFEKIADYIARRSGSRDVANQYIARFIDACDALAHSAQAYPLYRFSNSSRMMPFENYLILFQIRNDGVYIVHVRHAARKSFQA